MVTADLLRKIRQIEIKSKGLSTQVFSGEYHSAFKGKGMSFAQVREYQPGDDIRAIDWNVTARFNHTFVKIYEEERELSVVLMVDVSGSQFFGSGEHLKRDIVTELCATIAFSTITNNDKIGVIFFTDRIEKFIPPKKGKSHVLFIIRTLLDFKPEGNGTNLAVALEYLNRVVKKRSTVFLVSDFVSPAYRDALMVTRKKHDLVALHLSDPREKELPNIGMVQMAEQETGTLRWIDTSSSEVRKAHSRIALERQKQTEQLFQHAGVDVAWLTTEEPYTRPLMQLFRKRGAKG
jgi:uncharacterized protein (DUF58 family)